jgi:hypothetical protein
MFSMTIWISTTRLPGQRAVGIVSCIWSTATRQRGSFAR